jgi:hypothetical protein
VLTLIGNEELEIVASHQSSESGNVAGTFVVPQNLNGDQILALYAPPTATGTN